MNETEINRAIIMFAGMGEMIALLDTLTRASTDPIDAAAAAQLLSFVEDYHERGIA